MAVVSTLALCTFTSAFTQFVNPYPRDGWFETQYRLFGRFTGQDDYTPIAAPAVLYKMVHWLCAAAGWGLKQEFYAASIAQNGLLLMAACFIYFTCKYFGGRSMAAWVALAFVGLVSATGLAQAFWSENVVLALFAAVLYFNVTLYFDVSRSRAGFWVLAAMSSLVIGLLVVTRVTPVVLLPAIAFLLSKRLSRRRLFGYAALACTATLLCVGVTVAGNEFRFGRAELTNSSGRHLWQGVAPLAGAALAQSREFQELERLNPRLLDPHIQWRNWYAIRFPNDRRAQYDGEQMFARLSTEVIRHHPWAYLRLGLERFATMSLLPPPRLGSDPKGNHPLLSANPLNVDRALPPLAEVLLNLPASWVATGNRAVNALLPLSSVPYQIALFLVLTTAVALILGNVGRGRGQPRDAAILQLLCGAAPLALLYFNPATTDRLQIWIERGLCAAVLLLEAIILEKRGRQACENATPFGFLALVFFGSLWLSWQIEVSDTRIVLPYLPFLAAMLTIALSYWTGAWRSNPEPAPGFPRQAS